MHLILSRRNCRPDIIEGRLETETDILCHTLERTSYSLPVGDYLIRICKCKQHGRNMPLILPHNATMPDCQRCRRLPFVCHNTSMPQFCPQLSPGNGVANRHDGAVLVGVLQCRGLLVHPGSTFNQLYDLLRKHASRHHTITLTIVNSHHNNYIH